MGSCVWPEPRSIKSGVERVQKDILKKCTHCPLMDVGGPKAAERSYQMCWKRHRCIFFCVATHREGCSTGTESTEGTSSRPSPQRGLLCPPMCEACRVLHPVRGRGQRGAQGKRSRHAASGAARKRRLSCGVLHAEHWYDAINAAIIPSPLYHSPLFY